MESEILKQSEKIKKFVEAIKNDINEPDKVTCHVGQIEHAIAVIKAELRTPHYRSLNGTEGGNR